MRINTFRMFCIVVLAAALFFGGCANESDDSPPADSTTTAPIPESFTRSEFARYEMFSSAVSLSYRQDDFPHRVAIVFYGVAALAGENAVVHIPMFILSGVPPILVVTVDESMESEFLLSGTLALVTDPQAKCGTPLGACWKLTNAEVIFRDALGAEAFNAAFAAARFPE